MICTSISLSIYMCVRRALFLYISDTCKFGTLSTKHKRACTMSQGVDKMSQFLLLRWLRRCVVRQVYDGNNSFYRGFLTNACTQNIKYQTKQKNNNIYNFQTHYFIELCTYIIIFLFNTYNYLQKYCFKYKLFLINKSD